MHFQCLHFFQTDTDLKVKHSILFYSLLLLQLQFYVQLQVTTCCVQAVTGKQGFIIIIFSAQISSMSQVPGRECTNVLKW